ncbi:hypothetical protein EON65_54590 [archaeon]|nr:MAG: hypothetical protein EON65_54590 [archaeon]
MPVILVKLPRSGSTYLTDLLNQIPWLYLSKEIVQSKDPLKYSASDINEHLRQALVKPMEKIAYRHHILPSSRYMEDFVLKKKHLVKLQAVGFSINLEHVPHVNWTYILQSQPTPRVVLYMRTNLAKLAISAIKGELMHHICLKSNIRVSDESCVIPSQIHVSRQNFTFQLSRWLHRQSQQLVQVDKVFIQRAIPVLHVSYEMLQQNQTASMDVRYR